MVDLKCRIVRNRKTHECNNTVLLAVRHLRRFNPNIGLNPNSIESIRIANFLFTFQIPTCIHLDQCVSIASFQWVMFYLHFTE